MSCDGSFDRSFDDVRRELTGRLDALAEGAFLTLGEPVPVPDRRGLLRRAPTPAPTRYVQFLRHPGVAVRRVRGVDPVRWGLADRRGRASPAAGTGLAGARRSRPERHPAGLSALLVHPGGRPRGRSRGDGRGRPGPARGRSGDPGVARLACLDLDLGVGRQQGREDPVGLGVGDGLRLAALRVEQPQAAGTVRSRQVPAATGPVRLELPPEVGPGVVGSDAGGSGSAAPAPQSGTPAAG